MSVAAKIRLYVEHPLGAGQSVPLDRGQANYLFNVMRLGTGDAVALFNGRDGEWRSTVAEAGKRGGVLVAEAQTAPLRLPPDLWLMFAPIKKARTDFIVEKAAEMGAARIVPVQTEFTNAERVRQDRLQSHAIEAAEQCGGTYVPEVTDLHRLERLLADWPEGRRLMFCDETLAGQAAPLTDQHRGTPWAILIGPEGGFSEAERTRLAALPQSHAIALGPRILRADTAAVAALTLWQATLGTGADMIRDGALNTLTRLRGVLVALGVGGLGLWWALFSYGIVEWLGYLLVVLGLALLWTSLQRLRFGAGRDGPGLVQVDEGQIVYFGPLTGGLVAHSNLHSLGIDPTGRPAHWVLGQTGGDDLYIPVTATGTEALFDYFSALPGMRIDRLLSAARGGFDTPTQLWTRAPDTSLIPAPK